jgi:hypothetical protein
MKKRDRLTPKEDAELRELVRPLAEEPVLDELVAPPPPGCLPISQFAIGGLEGFLPAQAAHIVGCERCTRLKDRYSSTHAVGC